MIEHELQHTTMFDDQLVPRDCNGYIDPNTGTLAHDGETCPYHEANIYKIIAAPGIIYHTRAANIQTIAAKIAKGEPIRTIDYAAKITYSGKRVRDPDSEAIIGTGYISISREPKR